MPDSYPQSIRLHEQGLRHKTAVKDQLFREKKSKVEERRKQESVADQLASIEAAARAALQKDLAAGAPPPPPPPPPPAVGGILLDNGTGASYAGASSSSAVPYSTPTPWSTESTSSGSLPPPPPPSAPPRAPSRWGPAAAASSIAATPSPPEVEEDGVVGLYEVRGQSYLQGEHASEVLAVGSVCEAMLASGDQNWYPATITSIREVEVPNTELKIRMYMVTYAGQGDAEVEVGGHLLRLPLSAEEVEQMRSASSAAVGGDGDGGEQAAGPTFVIDENTGLGTWESIVAPVSEPTEASSEDSKHKTQSGKSRKRGRADDGLSLLHYDASKALDIMAEQQKQSDAKKAAFLAKDDDDDGFGAEDLLSAYSRSGSGARMYKGIVLEGDDVAADARRSAGDGSAASIAGQQQPRMVMGGMQMKLGGAGSSVGAGRSGAGAAASTSALPTAAAATAAAASSSSSSSAAHVVDGSATAPAMEDATATPAAPSVSVQFKSRKLGANVRIRRRDDDDD